MIKKLIFTIYCLTLFSMPSWASRDLPVDQFNIDPPPPDTAPIDDYLPFAILLMFFMVGYYFNKRTKLLKNNK